MSDLPLVSIMIPAHKPTYLAKTLASAIEQSYAPLEIVIADDSGEDEIASIVSSIADVRLNYVPNPNPNGLAGNYNFALQRACGRFGIFLDDDDLIYPCAVDKLVSAICTNPAQVMVYADYELADSDTGTRRRISRGRESILQKSREFYWQFTTMPPFTTAVIFDIGTARKCQIFDNVKNLKSSDWEAWLKISTCGLTGYLPEIAACHFRRQDGYSSISDLGMDVENADFINRAARHAENAAIMSQAECQRWQLYMQRWYFTWIVSNYIIGRKYLSLARAALDLWHRYPWTAARVLANPILITSFLLSFTPSLHAISKQFYRRLRFGTSKKPNF